MDLNQAINILIQAAHDGQAKGAYTLQQATAIAQAIDSLLQSAQNNAPKTAPKDPKLADKVVDAPAPTATEK